MKFKLEIDMGNDAMRSREDVCDLLVTVERILLDSLHMESNGAKLHDKNGNTVGKWEFVEES